MAIDLKPSTWIPGYTFDGTNVISPLASLPQLSSGEANATTGDIRAVMFALEEAMRAKFAATLPANRPTKWTVSGFTTAQQDAATETKTYNHTFVLTVTGVEVADEP